MDREDELVNQILAPARTVAVVGLSADPRRPSNEVAQYLQAHGFRVLPVNPAYAGTTVLGEKCFASLSEAAEEAGSTGGAIDIVNCFRKSEEVGSAVDEAIAIGAKAVWLQLGIVDDAAATRAQKAGLLVVMDKCIKIEHMRGMTREAQRRFP